MKTLLMLLIILFNQEVHPILSPEFRINGAISEVEKGEILRVVNATINQYCNASNFWNNENNKFDNDKYNDFIKLFAGTAYVVDDISFSKDQIPYSEYAEIIFNNLHENGVPFKIEKAIINSIDIDETGFYVIDVSFTKRLFSGLNKNGHPINLQRGRSIQLNMRIDLPNYLLTDARIQYIKAEKSNKILKYIKKPVGYLNEVMKRKN